jgi:hypothetical protein
MTRDVAVITLPLIAICAPLVIVQTYPLLSVRDGPTAVTIWIAGELV